MYRANQTTVSIKFGVPCPVKGESQDYIHVKGETAAKVLINDTALILGTLFAGVQLQYTNVELVKFQL